MVFKTTRSPRLILCILAAVMLLQSCADAGKPVDTAPETDTVDTTDTTPASDIATATDTETAVPTTETADTAAPFVIPEPDDESDYVPGYDYKYGSAGTLEKGTVVVSVFVDDAATSWGDSASDEMMKNLMRTNLIAACDWLTEKAAEYGKQAWFFCDWKKYPELARSVRFKDDLTSDHIAASLLEADHLYYKESFRINKLRQKYHAENVIFLFFFNTEFDNDLRPCAMPAIDDYTICEFSNLYAKWGRRRISNNGIMAHEILHLFGAHDLYYEEFEDGEGYLTTPIKKEYIEHLMEEYEAGTYDRIDIMCGSYELIDLDLTSTVSELTAYYVGWTDSSADQEEWDLPLAERFSD